MASVLTYARTLALRRAPHAPDSENSRLWPSSVSRGGARLTAAISFTGVPAGAGSCDDLSGICDKRREAVGAAMAPARIAGVRIEIPAIFRIRINL